MSILTRLKRVDVISNAFGINVIFCRGADLGPLDAQGFIDREQLATDELKQLTEPHKQALLAKLLESISDQKFTGLLSRIRLTRKINAALAEFGETVLAVAPESLAKAQVKIAEETRQKTQELYFTFARSKFSETELLELEALRRHNALFMGSYLKGTMPEKAKMAVIQAYNDAAGLKPAEKNKAIQQALATKFGKLVDAPDSYWPAAVTTGLNNARTYAQLKTFASQPNVIAYRVQAELDSKTSNICRTLHGKVFAIKQALALYDKVFNAQTMDEIKVLTPMVYGNAKTGFFTGSAQNKTAVNTEDYQGLLAAGIRFPPFHHFCRSLILPVYGTVSVPEGDLDFDDQVLLSEYHYHFRRMKQITAEIDRLEKLKDKVERDKGLTQLNQTFLAETQSLQTVWNADVWRNSFAKKVSEIQKLGKKDGIGMHLKALRGRVVDAQGAYWARANKHQLLAFNFEMSSQTAKPGNYVEQEMDLVTHLSGTLNVFQFKYGDIGSKSFNDLKHQISKNLAVIQEPDAFVFKPFQAKFKKTRDQRDVYRKLNQFFDGEFPVQRNIYGAVNKEAIRKKRFESDIIKPGLNTNVYLIQDLGDIDFKTFEIKGA